MKTLVFLRNPLVPGFWPAIGRVGILRRVIRGLEQLLGQTWWAQHRQSRATFCLAQGPGLSSGLAKARGFPQAPRPRPRAETPSE
jgi:hypothetical protein